MKSFVSKNPVIKWTGSKRSVASQILKHTREHQSIHIEPFLGGGSVSYKAMEEELFDEYILSDTNSVLIDLHTQIKQNYKTVYEHYEDNWFKLDSNIEHYYQVRDRFNANPNSLDFNFLLRTCFNGMVRYNSKGEFNTPYHLNRKGIKPEKFKIILEYYNKLLNGNNVYFKCCDFSEIESNENSFLFVDPPYTSSNSLYNGNIDSNQLIEWLNNQPSFALTFNSINSKDNEFDFDSNGLSYDDKLALETGNSSFSRLKGNSSINVKEYLYLKYETQRTS